MSNISESDDENHPYVIVQFVTRGKKEFTKQLDIVEIGLTGTQRQRI